MGKAGRRTWTPKASTPPDVLAAMDRLFVLWHDRVEAVRERHLGVPPGSLPWQRTVRRMRSIEIPLRGLFNRAPLSEPQLASAIAAYAAEVTKAWYRDAPMTKIATLVEWMGDEDVVLRWLAGGQAASIADERKAEQALMARRRQEEARRQQADRHAKAQVDVAQRRAERAEHACRQQQDALRRAERAAALSAQTRAVNDEIDRLASQDPAALAALERTARASMGAGVVDATATVQTSRYLRAVVGSLLRTQMFLQDPGG